MANSNSALKISQGYGFKPGFGHFSIKSKFLGPQGPCDYEFWSHLSLGKGHRFGPWALGAHGALGAHRAQGAHGTHGDPWVPWMNFEAILFFSRKHSKVLISVSHIELKYALDIHLVKKTSRKYVQHLGNLGRVTEACGVLPTPRECLERRYLHYFDIPALFQGDPF